KEVCGAVERWGTRAYASADPQRKKPGEASVEGRCLGGRRRLERQLDHPGLGHQCVHDLPGTQVTGGRGLRSGVEPQAARDTARRCDFRRREGSQADRPGVLRAAEGTVRSPKSLKPKSRWTRS